MNIETAIEQSGEASEGEAKEHESSKPCGSKWESHFYDDGYCEFCGIHEDEA